MEFVRLLLPFLLVMAVWVDVPVAQSPECARSCGDIMHYQKSAKKGFPVVIIT
jgi:hypothetical protein